MNYWLNFIFLSLVASIIKNGYYIGEDFEGSFIGWEKERTYETYLDSFKYLQLEDDEAQEIFDQVIEAVFHEKSVINPITLLLILNRVITDVHRGSLVFDDPEKRFVDLIKNLYETGSMEYLHFNDFDYFPEKFGDISEVFDEVLELNNQYVKNTRGVELRSIWKQFSSNSENIKGLLSQFSGEPIFSAYDEPQEVLDAIECLDNAQIFEMLRWMGSRLRDANSLDARKIEKLKSNKLGEFIEAKYSNIYSIRASHLKQMVKVLKSQSL